MPERILIRADGSPRTGTGHVMRCLALAQGWQRTGGQAIFAQAETTPALQERLSGEGLEVVRLKVAPGTEEDAGQTAIEARSNAVTAVVADGYVFGALWQRRIKDAGFRLLLVDDFAHAEHYAANPTRNCCWARATPCCAATFLPGPNGSANIHRPPAACSSRWVAATLIMSQARSLTHWATCETGTPWWWSAAATPTSPRCKPRAPRVSAD
jgi:hypothetical protein